eukprot:TRINITY_DN9139_c0_g2_i5.p2 TRINITY_DN9139_c0_g2~~TRINITY_DN9139_c0_g2_i5.p2  ORF type:complete len:624 (+),score=218.82 TRINITY_DN9139_c0_g2_i5:87-1874(+)
MCIRDREKARLMETIEELNNKLRKSKGTLEEEIALKERAEAELAEKRKKFQEISNALVNAQGENSQMANEIQTLTREVEKKEESLRTEGRKSRTLQRELEDLKSEIAIDETQKKEFAKNQKEIIETLKRENKSLSDRIIEVTKIEGEKLEREINEHFETKSKLKLAENTIQGLKFDLENQGNNGSRLRSQINEIEGVVQELREKNAKLEKSVNGLAEERQELARVVEKKEKSIQGLKNMFNNSVIAKCTRVRKDLESLKDQVKGIFETNVKAQRERLRDSYEELKDLWRAHLLREKDSIIDYSNRELHENLRGLKEKFINTERQIRMEFDARFHEQEKVIEFLKENKERLENEVHQSEKENHGLRKNIESLQNEMNELQRELGGLRQESETLRQRAEVNEGDSRQVIGKYQNELKSLKHQLVMKENGWVEERNDMQHQFRTEANNLVRAVELLKESNARNMSEMESKLREVEKQYEAEIGDLKTKFQAKINNFKYTLATLEQNEDDLRSKNLRASETIETFERRNADLERELGRLRKEYEGSLRTLQSSLESVGKEHQLEIEKNMKMRVEKNGEVDRLMRQICLLYTSPSPRDQA